MVLAIGQAAKDIRWFDVIKEIDARKGRIDLDRSVTKEGSLHYACMQGVDIEVIKFLLKAGAEVNRVDEDGFTAASSLTDRGHSGEYVLNVLKLLFANGLEKSYWHWILADYLRAMTKPVAAIEWLIQTLGEYFSPEERPYMRTSSRTEITQKTPWKDQSKPVFRIFQEQMKKPGRASRELKRIYDQYVKPLMDEGE
jgi:hypothetical protein